MSWNDGDDSDDGKIFLQREERIHFFLSVFENLPPCDAPAAEAHKIMDVFFRKLDEELPLG